MRRQTALFLLALAAALSPGLVLDGATETASAGESSRLELVQTWPVDAQALRDPSMRDVHEVWLEMIDGATAQISLAHFYASNQKGSRLEPIILALVSAAARGVKIRFLSDKGFYKTYPETLDRLGAIEGITMRLWDVRALTGGVLHAKYLTVDDDEVYVGSQNFDWRALEHIQELGAHVVDAPIAREFQSIFDADWRRAAGEAMASQDPDLAVEPAPHELDFRGSATRAHAVFSPRDLLPEGRAWDLPDIVSLMDEAHETVRVQLLNYKAVGYDRKYWPVLENALRAAAARGVKVELLLSHWSQRRYTIEGLQSLQCLPNIEVKILTPPEHSDGFIAFARVVHAKYLVVDGAAAWVGTSNWQKDYFFSSRNAGLILFGDAIGSALDAYFERNWRSPYSETVDPGRSYEAPRVSE
jgi:phosphatidylserine/phosphatidylglycerophosphate/cardiolipin synthase-like enzyme